jgi:hypothetical protein
MPGADLYRQRHRTLGSSPRLPDEELIRPSGDFSPAKRRRITKPHDEAPTNRSDAVIEIVDDDDDIREVSSRPAIAPVYASFDTISTASTPRSNGSWNTASGSRSRAQSSSEFGAVDQVACPHRKKSRKTNVNTGSTTNHRTLSNTGRASQMVSPVIDADDDPSVRPESARKQILSDFHQGSNTSSINHARSVRDTGAVASHHFPKAQVNESTSSTYVQTADAGSQRRISTDKNLREHRRVQASNERDQDQISSSSDDLAKPNVHAELSRHSREQARPIQTANSGAKRKASERHSMVWGLARARSSNVDWIEATPETQLFLLCNVEPWKIAEATTRQEFIVKMEIDSKLRVNKVSSDRYSRIRLEGPRPNNGCTPVWDLQFVKSEDLLQFIEKHANPVIAGHVSEKEE